MTTLRLRAAWRLLRHPRCRIARLLVAGNWPALDRLGEV